VRPRLAPPGEVRPFRSLGLDRDDRPAGGLADSCARCGASRRKHRFGRDGSRSGNRQGNDTAGRSGRSCSASSGPANGSPVALLGWTHERRARQITRANAISRETSTPSGAVEAEGCHRSGPVLRRPRACGPKSMCLEGQPLRVSGVGRDDSGSPSSAQEAPWLGTSFTLHVNLVRRRDGWRVFDVAEASPHVRPPAPIGDGPGEC
jgi:hypothetical protein